MRKNLFIALLLIVLQANAQKTHNAQYPEGEKALFEFIEKNLVTPTSAIQQKVYGTIYVRVEVDKEGNTTKVGVTKPSGQDDMDKEAERVVSLIKKWTPAQKKGKPMDGEVIVAVEFKQEYDATTVVTASYPGGDEAMQAFFDKNFVFPEDLASRRLIGTIYVEMDIDENGKSSNVHVTSPSEYPALDEEAERVVSLVNKWIPAKNNGVPFKNIHVIPVDFKSPALTSNDKNNQNGKDGGDTGNIGQTNTSSQNNTNGEGVTSTGGKTGGKNDVKPTSNTTVVTTTLASMPAYPGGMIKMGTFISQNRKYPEEELKKKIEGDVVVMVLIDEQGNIQNPRIHKSVNPNLDAEAIRIVKLMPKWEPAEDVNGNPVPCEMPITINFRTPKALDGVPFH